MARRASRYGAGHCVAQIVLKRRRWLRRTVALLFLAFLGYQSWIFVHVWYWKNHNPATTAFMTERLAKMRATNLHARIRRRWMPYRRISNTLKRAVIAAEDTRFLDHDGFDWQGIQHAYQEDLKAGKIIAGGSTISQQLAKNLFLSPRRTLWRKLEETLITVMLEQTMSKRRILALYLNLIEWGNGIFGAEAAARHYFGVSAARLTPAQAAWLAAIIPNPRYYDRHRRDRWTAKKSAIILARMREAAIP